MFLHVRNSYEIHGSLQKVSGSSGKFPGVSGNLPGPFFQLPGTGELLLGLVQRCPGWTVQGASGESPEVLRPGPFGGRVCDSLSQPTWALVLVRGWVGGRGPPPCPRLTVQNELGPGFT